MRRDIAVAQPVAFIEHLSDHGFANNLYICQAVNHRASVRELVANFNQGQQEFLGLSKSRALQQLAQFINKMHLRGVYYRDLSAGNILLNVQDDHLQMTIIDTNRARFYNHPVSMRQRLSDLVRICNKMNNADRGLFLNYYFAGAALKKPWLTLLPFYLYDSKVMLKRMLGRKAWRKLWPSKRTK
jgi:serine/threonine protein kinase